MTDGQLFVSRAKIKKIMSRLDDYSKFDHIDSDTDDFDDDDGGAPAIRDNDTEVLAHASNSATASPPTAVVPRDDDAPHGTTTKHPTIADRYVFAHGGRKVYEWEQNLDEVILYIDAPMDQLPKDNPARYIVVDIMTNGLWVGLRGGDRYFINERTYDKVKVKESSWYFDKEEGVINVVL